MDFCLSNYVYLLNHIIYNDKIQTYTLYNYLRSQSRREVHAWGRLKQTYKQTDKNYCIILPKADDCEETKT